MRNAFILDISTENAAFEDTLDGRGEVARILREIADRLDEGQHNGTARDVNGNKCGSWRLMSAED